MSVPSISYVKRLSLILSRKAYLIYTNNIVPSILVPLPQIDKTVKSALVKRLNDLTNNQTIIFNPQNHIKKQNQPLQSAKLQIDETSLPKFQDMSSIENITVQPDSLFLTLNYQDSSLNFMKYKDIQNSILTAKTQKTNTPNQTEKPKQTKKNIEKQAKQAKKSTQTRKPGEQEQFNDEEVFEHKQMSTWNEQSPQLATKPEDQPKQDISSLRTNKFIPLAILTEKEFTKPIEISYVQTSRQYLLLQMLKIFCVANILCVYGLINDASRTQNHQKAKKLLQ